jgi:hypothetical protein
MPSRPAGGQLVQLDKIVAWGGAVLFATVFTVLWLSHWFRWVKEVTNWTLQGCKQDGNCQFSFWNIMLC